MVSALGSQLWTTIQLVRETEFGAILRNARLSPGSGRSPRGFPPGTTTDPLQSWELSFDPAVHRTFAAIMMMSLLDEQIPSESSEWIEWNLGAFRVLQRMAAKCWRDVPREVWQVFLDEDSLISPASRFSICGLRDDKQGHPSLRFAGLDSGPVTNSLTELASLLRSTPEAVAAAKAGQRITRSTTALVELQSIRQRILESLKEVRAGETFEEAFERMRKAVSDAYSGAGWKSYVDDLRRYNRLLHQVMSAVVGGAEQFNLLEVNEIVGGMSVTLQDGCVRLDVTIDGDAGAMPRLFHPVNVMLGSPYDDLYIVHHHTFSFGGGTSHDLGLVALSTEN